MKKKLMLSLLTGALLLSGCSFGNEEEEKKENPAPVATEAQESSQPKTAPIIAEKKSTQSPEELFYTLAQANADYTVNLLKENLPSKETIMKGEKNISIDGKVSLIGTPAQSGNLDFKISGRSAEDFTAENAVKIKKDIVFNASLSDAPITGDAKGNVEMQVVDNGIYANLQKLEINSPLIPKEQVEAMTQNIIGKWYGNTFAELNALQGANPQMDIQKLITGTPLLAIFWEATLDEQSNLKEYLSFVSLVEAKNGTYTFEAKYNAQKSKDMMKKILSAFGTSDEIQEKAMKELDSMQDQLLTIQLKASDASYVSIITPARDLNTQKVIEGKKNTFTYSNTEIFAEIFTGGEDKVVFSVKDNKFSLTGNSQEKKDIDLLTGTYSANNMTFQTQLKAMNEYAPGEFVGTFTKSGNTWAGKISNTINSAILVKISNASYSKEKITLSVAIENTQAGEAYNYGPVNFKATIHPINSVSVEKPATVLPFQDIAKAFAPQQTQVVPAQNN